MANQMIALQARNPQLPDPQQRTARLANMMNATRQAEAAQLQGERIRQEMEYAQAAEGRAVQTQTSAQKKAELEYVGLVAKQFEQDVAKLADGNTAGAEALRANIVREIPAWDKFISPASEWTPEYKARLSLKAKEIYDKVFPDVTASKEYAAAGARDAQGNPIPEGTVIDTRVGGFEGAAGSTPLKERSAATTAPRATPTAPPVAVGQYGETLVTPDSARPLTADQQDHIRRMQEDLGMVDTPASFTRGAVVQMPPEVMSRIVDSAFETGVMAQVDFDQLLASQPQQNKQALVDSFRRANITLQADAPSLADSALGQPSMAANPVQTPQAEFADLRGQRMQSQTAGLRGAPPMEQTLAQYIPVQRRDPNVSPLPGSAQVPIERVRQEAAAGRETANEVYAKELARARAVRDAAKITGPKPLTPVQEAKLRDNIAKDYKSARSTISMMLDPIAGVVATVDKVRKLSPAQKEAITGYSGYLPSITPGARSADTAIKNLRGKVTEMGKSAAALTGAIGQMAVQEWRIVSDMIASLDIEGMEPADLDNQLDIIEAQARRAAEVTRDAYENQYVEEFARYPGRFQLPSSAGKTPVTSRPKAESQLPRIRGNADYNKLKPGTEFIDPNGVRRRKPK